MKRLRNYIEELWERAKDGELSLREWLILLALAFIIFF
jgi:hypothetical protein